MVSFLPAEPAVGAVVVEEREKRLLFAIDAGVGGAVWTGVSGVGAERHGGAEGKGDDSGDDDGGVQGCALLTDTATVSV